MVGFIQLLFADNRRWLDDISDKKLPLFPKRVSVFSPNFHLFHSLAEIDVDFPLPHVKVEKPPEKQRHFSSTGEAVEATSVGMVIVKKVNPNFQHLFRTYSAPFIL